MISPALACSKIIRVLVMFNASRNSVVNNSMLGKVENESTFGMYRDIMNITTEIVKLSEISASSIAGGTGTIIKEMTMTRIIASSTSLKREYFATHRSNFATQFMPFPSLSNTFAVAYAPHLFAPVPKEFWR